MRRARDLRDAQDRESAQTVASALVAKTITIPVKAGAEGRSVRLGHRRRCGCRRRGAGHIVLDRKKLHVDHIKTTGTYQWHREVAPRRRVPDHHRGGRQVIPRRSQQALPAA
jgi:large subunit ribosomal protein L9